jgi:NAD(P)H-dependent flavin oxidoreductase YrpB (nitropropane dioxygenase family)
VLEVELPIFQAPLAGVQGGALAIAASNTGGRLGSLPNHGPGTDQAPRTKDDGDQYGCELI